MATNIRTDRERKSGLLKVMLGKIQSPLDRMKLNGDNRNAVMHKLCAMPCK